MDEIWTMAQLRERMEKSGLTAERLRLFQVEQAAMDRAQQERHEEMWGEFKPPVTVLLSAAITRQVAKVDLLFDGEPLQLDGRLAEITGTFGRVLLWIDGGQVQLMLPRGAIDRPVPWEPHNWSGRPKRCLEEAARRAGADIPPRLRFWEDA